MFTPNSQQSQSPASNNNVNPAKQIQYLIHFIANMSQFPVMIKTGHYLNQNMSYAGSLLVVTMAFLQYAIIFINIPKKKAVHPYNHIFQVNTMFCIKLIFNQNQIIIQIRNQYLSMMKINVYTICHLKKLRMMYQKY